MARRNPEGWTWFDAIVGIVIAMLLWFGVHKAARAEPPDIYDLEKMVALASRVFERPVFDLPAVHIVAHDALRPGQLAAYRLNVIWLRADYDNSNPMWRSILFHEVVHHVQEKLGRFGTRSHCPQIAARENEAYRLQSLYLAHHGGAGFRFTKKVCL